MILRRGHRGQRFAGGFFLALIPHALSQRLNVIFGQGHRYVGAARPSPEIARHTQPISRNSG